MHENYDRLRLRWRFDFSNRKPRFGQWTRPASRKEDMAAFNHSQNLVRASIEAQNIATGEILPIAECDGHEFVNFQWISALFGLEGGHVKIVGMALTTRDYRAEVYVDGTSKVEPRSEDDKKFNYATFGV